MNIIFLAGNTKQTLLVTPQAEFLWLKYITSLICNANKTISKYVWGIFELLKTEQASNTGKIFIWKISLNKAVPRWSHLKIENQALYL